MREMKKGTSVVVMVGFLRPIAHSTVLRAVRRIAKAIAHAVSLRAKEPFAWAADEIGNAIKLSMFFFRPHRSPSNAMPNIQFANTLALSLYLSATRAPQRAFVPFIFIYVSARIE